MTFLLDVNVLIALIPGHVAHDDAHAWFDTIREGEWACPLTENEVIRIGGSPKYPYSPGLPAEVAEIVRKVGARPGHQFWPDDLNLVGPEHVDATKIMTSGQVTDTFLLALAKAKGGQLATFNRRLC